MGSCFKSIFNRKKDTYHFVHPYSAQEGKYQTKDEVQYQGSSKTGAKVSDGVAGVVASGPSSPPPQQDHDVVDFMGKEEGGREEVERPNDVGRSEAAQRVEDINDNKIINEVHLSQAQHQPQEPEAPLREENHVHITQEEVAREELAREEVAREEFARGEVAREEVAKEEVEFKASAVDEAHSYEDDSTAEEDLTAAIAEVVEEAKTLSEQDLSYGHNTDADDDSNNRSPRQNEVVREDVLAVEERNDEPVSTDSVSVTVVQSDYLHSARDESPSRRSSSTKSDLSDRPVAEVMAAPEAFQDLETEGEQLRTTETVEEFREPAEDGTMTVITVTTTEVTRTSEEEDGEHTSHHHHDHHEDEEDDTREPSIALLNEKPAVVTSSHVTTTEHQTTTSVMVNGDEVDELPKELSDLDTIDSGPPSPSVVHINTSFPVDQ